LVWFSVGVGLLIYALSAWSRLARQWYTPAGFQKDFGIPERNVKNRILKLKNKIPANLSIKR